MSDCPCCARLMPENVDEAAERSRTVMRSLLMQLTSASDELDEYASDYAGSNCDSFAVLDRVQTFLNTIHGVVDLGNIVEIAHGEEEC